MAQIITIQKINHDSVFDWVGDCTEVAVRCGTTGRTIWSKRYYDDSTDFDVRKLAEYLANGRKVVELPTILYDWEGIITM
jgi:hypothetical protein